MGYYIGIEEPKGKAMAIVRDYSGEILNYTPNWDEIPEDKALVCVVDNGPFEAAGLCTDENEFNRFIEPDTIRKGDGFSIRNGIPTYSLDPTEQRPRTWVLMPKDKAYELSGYKG